MKARELTRDDALTLQFRSALPQYIRKVFQVIPCGDPEFPDKVPRSAFEISVIPIFVCVGDVILGSPKISITADRAGAFEALETLLGLGLGRWVEVIAAEEFIGRDAFLGAEFLTGIFFVVI